MTAEARIQNLLSPARSRIAVLALAGAAALWAAPPAAASWARAVPAAGGGFEPGTGALLWGPPDARLPLPMLDLQVNLEVTGVMVHGSVIQAFENPTDATIEALYAFPLPEEATVHHMEIRIGDRRIVSVIQEKQQARRNYQAARSEGRKAALLEQQRPNMFTTAVAAINAGEQVQVRLEYVEELSYRDGGFELAFPLTYTPRYGAPAMGSGEPAPVLPPSARLSVRIRPGMPLQETSSTSHALASWWDNEDRLIQPGADGVVAADRDFHLRLVPQVGREPEAAFLVEEREDGRYGMLVVLPPPHMPEAEGLATETLFILDISGSMSGPSIRQAREALVAALDRLHPDDGFDILAFNDRVSGFSGGYVPAGEIERQQARRWLDGLSASGGTRIDLALEAGLALAGRDEGWRVERIVFITDGAVNAEAAILARIRAGLGSVRLHTLGIGAAPNRYLMRRMADFGRGLCEFISDKEQAENRIDAFFARLARPVMTDIAMTWQGVEPLEAYPARLPDLHSGEPLVLSLRLPPGAAAGRLVLDGRLGGGTVRRVVDLPAGVAQPTGIAARWARARAGDLLDSLHEGAEPEAVRQAVIDVSRRFGIVTSFTSLVAVEEYATANGESLTVKVPAAFPGGGQLPQGGSDEPLLRLLALLCGLTACAVGLAAHRVRWRVPS